MGQHVRRRVERRIWSPPSAPLRVVLPTRRAELAGAHDLRADAVLVTLGEGVVDAGSAGGVPESGRDHPLVEPMPGVAERRLQRQAVTGAEPVERDREVVNPDARHSSSFGCDVRPQMAGRAVSRAPPFVGPAAAMRVNRYS